MEWGRRCGNECGSGESRARCHFCLSGMLTVSKGFCVGISIQQEWIHLCARHSQVPDLQCVPSFRGWFKNNFADDTCGGKLRGAHASGQLTTEQRRTRTLLRSADRASPPRSVFHFPSRTHKRTKYGGAARWLRD